MKRKLIAALSLIVSALLFAGSSFSMASAEAETDNAQTESTAAEMNAADAEWESIISLNEGQKIINMFDGNGYMTFLGNRYTDSVVTNEEEALASLDCIYNLLGLDGVNLSYYKTDVSPITENIYYTFFQTTKGEIDGQELDARYYSSLLKVITDKNGAVLGISSDLIHDTELEFSGEKFVTREEAENYVAERINSDCRLYTDATELVYWDDDKTAGYQSASKVVPAYIVFADADLNNQNNISHQPYAVYVVSAEYTRDDKQPVRCMAVFYTDSVNTDSIYGVYVSSLFFDVMEDVGNYTYTVNLDWVKDSYDDYAGDMSMEVTVPVMKNTESGLYYLGSKEKLITCTNEYDFDYYNTLNSYVTENPEDLNSWHFAQNGLEEENILEYFNDPNYVISAFSVFCDVANDFEEKYKLPSVSSSDIPLLLCVYKVDQDKYPDSVSGFERNACNLGQIRDWAVMCVSPVLAECLNHAVMSHEYTHGINSQLTETQYLNSPGALMESYADIIGVQMAMLNNRIEPDEYWNIAGTYAAQMRSMADPLGFHQPKYLQGIYYVSPIDSTLGKDLDYGGVHQNSGICNYLAYCLVNGKEEIENPALFTLDENLDMWFETLYMTNYKTDFDDEGQYLKFAAKCMDIPAEKQQYLAELLRIFGMDSNEDGVNIPEDGKEITFTVEALDEANNELYDIGFCLLDSEDNYICVAGDTKPGNSLSCKVKADEVYYPRVYIGDLSNCQELSNLDLTYAMADDYHIYLETAVCKTGIEYTIDCNAYQHINTDFYDTFDQHMKDNGDGTFTFYSENPGLFYIALSNHNDGECKIIELYIPDNE